MFSKDYFSPVAKSYRKYRPSNIPQELYQELSQATEENQAAYDCGTGNGQVANQLVAYYDRVYASDASSEQIRYAIKNSRIKYFIAQAESSILESKSIDLITVSQAFHWFDREAFYTEARRILKPKGVIAIWCYGYFDLPKASESLNEVVQNVLKLVKPFWPPERELIERKYQSFPFPFDEIPIPEGKYSMTHEWTAEQLIGYLCTWSATQKLIEEQGNRELNDLISQIKQHWIALKNTMTVIWPLYFRVGRTN